MLSSAETDFLSSGQGAEIPYMNSNDQNCGACADDVTTPPFVMAFQPIVDVQERRIYGYEALVRGPDGQSAMSVLSQITAENRYAFDQACRVKPSSRRRCLGWTGV